MGDDTLTKGDYVLATKYNDGDPNDHWVVGFYDRFDGERHYVVDSEGNQMRGNGFRRVQRIEREVGRWIVDHMKEAELSGLPVWEHWLPAAFAAVAPPPSGEM